MSTRLSRLSCDAESWSFALGAPEGVENDSIASAMNMTWDHEATPRAEWSSHVQVDGRNKR